MELLDSSPLMKQYYDLKTQAPDCLLLFRMGDFYELFGDDAITAARILEITLTSRDKNKPNPIPMAGVPHHSVQGYIQRLLKAGKKVAIGEQMEDPALSKASGKSIVRRDIVRILTPAVQFDHDGAESAFLATVIRQAKTDGVPRWTLACLDASTGELRIGEPSYLESVCQDLAALPIKHLLIHHDLPTEIRSVLSPERGTLIEELASNYLSLAQAESALKSQFDLATLDTFFQSEAAIRAAGILVTYVARSQRRETLGHLQLPLPLHRARSMILGPRTSQHLDLITDQGGDLFSLINRAKSAPGARTLKRWLSEPLLAKPEIETRQRAVRELSEQSRALEGMGSLLGQVYDLERILGRIYTGLANPRDSLALGRSLSTLPQLGKLLAPLKYEGLGRIATILGDAHQKLESLTRSILDSQKDDAPLVVRDGGIFKTGVDPELDRFISLNENGEKWLIELEARERAATGIPSLKVRYNRVFGYYIEITQAHAASAPAHYQRKQTMVGAERFFTEELKKFEEEILTASSRQKQLEQELFDRLLEKIRAHSSTINEAARALGELDALASLAHLASQPGWIFPQLDDSLDLEITGGRHPLVDFAMGGRFVPNDLVLSPDTHLTLLITGPNMGGKSTVMRQVALIVILGQIGAPVPAQHARWGVVSAVYTRIGAQDAIARGQSTFMVEMAELAHILHHADERSLLILDEIGRGTSTYDGISVAWASLEWICSKIRARTLFATHYHELTRLSGSLPSLGNAHMAVDGAKSGQMSTLRFLFELRDGAAAESFGVHVAHLAGLPKPVIDKAWQVLEELERQGPALGTTSSLEQLSLFGQLEVPHSSLNVRAPEALPKALPLPPPAWMGELTEADLNGMTPLQALNFLAWLQSEAKTPAAAGANR